MEPYCLLTISRCRFESHSLRHEPHRTRSRTILLRHQALKRNPGGLSRSILLSTCVDSPDAKKKLFESCTVKLLALNNFAVIQVKES